MSRLDGRTPGEVYQLIPDLLIAGSPPNLIDGLFGFGFVPGSQHHFIIPRRQLPGNGRANGAGGAGNDRYLRIAVCG